MSILKLYSRSNSTVGQSLLPDWQSVFYLPLAARRAVYAPGHQRWKKEHFNCKIYTAWDKNALYIDFAVRARTPHNLAAEKFLWREDCFEVLLLAF